MKDLIYFLRYKTQFNLSSKAVPICSARSLNVSFAGVGRTIRTTPQLEHKKAGLFFISHIATKSSIIIWANCSHPKSLAFRQMHVDKNLDT